LARGCGILHPNGLDQLGGLPTLAQNSGGSLSLFLVGYKESVLGKVKAHLQVSATERNLTYSV
jgi:hypothetical protein